MSELEKKILAQIEGAIAESVVKELVGYNKPLSELTSRVIKANEQELYDLINTEFSGLLQSDCFREELKSALNSKLAKVLIGRMGGELESQVNKLKADPTTRARITLAIEEIVKQ